MNRLCDVSKGRFPIAIEAKVLVGCLQDLLAAFVVRGPPLSGDPAGLDCRLLLQNL